MWATVDVSKASLRGKLMLSQDGDIIVLDEKCAAMLFVRIARQSGLLMQAVEEPGEVV